jgi:hypothetical protein
VAIEQTIEPLKLALIEFLSVFAIDVEKIIALIFILIAGVFVARYGKSIIQKIIVRIFKNEWVTKHSKISPKDFDDAHGWKSLLTLVPKLISVFILFFFFMAGLNVLEFTQASESLSEVWAFIPNIGVFVVLLIFGSIATNIGNEWFKKESNLFGKSTIPRYGFNLAVWFSVLTTGFTQLGIGTEIIPIIVGGIMGMLIVVVYGLRREITGFINIESLKTMGIENGMKVKFAMNKRIYKVIKLGVTHTEFESEGNRIILNNKNWYSSVEIVKDDS